MRVLILHSKYLSGPASGENRVVEDEARLLETHGHTTRVWAPEPEESSVRDVARAGFGSVWSRRAATETRRLIRTWKPDVAHFHNLFPMLSPVAVRAAADEGVPVVMTLHNYRLMCLPAVFLRDGHVCEDCLGRVPWPGVVHRCYRGSSLGSGALATSLTLHRTLKTFDKVTLYLAASRFLRDKYIQAGFREDCLVVKPNFAWETARREGAGEYFLFLGRLSYEKGAETLLRAWEPRIGRLVIAGEGPEAESLRTIAPKGVEFRGLVQPAEVPRLVAGARALLVPSKSYEGAARSIIEAYAAGVPVIASRIGAITESVEHGVSGLLVPPDDAGLWAKAIEQLLDNDVCARLGDGAWNLWNRRFRPEVALELLENSYQMALARLGLPLTRSVREGG